MWSLLSLITRAALILTLTSTMISADDPPAPKTESSTFDMDKPQETLKQWLELQDKLEDARWDVGKPGDSCIPRTTDEMIALTVLYEVFINASTSNRSTGLLEMIWKRAPFYSRHFQKLIPLAANATGLCMAIYENDYDVFSRVVCHKGLCTLCLSPQIDNDAELVKLCELVKPENVPDPTDTELDTNKDWEAEIAPILAQRKNHTKPIARELSWEEFLEWKAIFEGIKANSTDEKHKICNENPYLTVAAQIIWQMYNNYENDETAVKYDFEEYSWYYENFLGVLANATKEDFLCNWDQYCGADGLCTECFEQGIPEAFNGVCDNNFTYREEWTKANRITTPKDDIKEEPTSKSSKVQVELIFMTVAVVISRFQ